MGSPNGPSTYIGPNGMCNSSSSTNLKGNSCRLPLHIICIDTGLKSYEVGE